MRKEFYSSESQPVHRNSLEVEEIDQFLRHGAVGEFIQLNKLGHCPGTLQLPKPRLAVRSRNHTITYSVNLGSRETEPFYIPHQGFPRRISLSPNRIDYSPRVHTLPPAPKPKTPVEYANKRTLHVTVGVSTSIES